MMAKNPIPAAETRNPNRTVERIRGLERDKARRLLKLAKRGQRDPREKFAPVWLIGHEAQEMRRERRFASTYYLGDRAADGLCDELLRRATEGPRPGDIWAAYNPEHKSHCAWILTSKNEETGTWRGLKLRRYGCGSGYRLSSDEPCGPIAVCLHPVDVWQRLQWRIGFIKRATLRDLQITYRRPARR